MFNMWPKPYPIDKKRGFIASKGNSIKVFDNYDNAVKFIQSHYGYTLTYYYNKAEA